MHPFVRRALFTTGAVALSAVVLIGTAAAGFATTMARDFAVVAPAADAAAQRPTPTAAASPGAASGAGSPADRIHVAVLLGAGGSVATDVMGPFDVFGSSPRFEVRTVAATRDPVALSGGLTVVPDGTFEEYASGRLRLPELLVVPAITDPAGAGEAELRALIETAHQAGSTVMGVCAGALVLAETDVLDGREATSFWSDLEGLRASHPETTWVGGERWVDEGDVVTTAGVSSGIAASLHLVQKLAGPDEAVRIADRIRYPHWAPDAATDIPVNAVSPADYPYALGATLPWGQPRYGIGLTPGVDEIDVAAAAELYGGVAFTAHTVPVAETPEVITKHGLRLLATPLAEAGDLDRLVVPGVTTTTLSAGDAAVFLPASSAVEGGNTSFDPVLADIARTDGRHLAETAAKYIEYPAPELLDDSGFPLRVTVLAIGVVLLSIAAGLIPLGVARVRRRLRSR